MSEEKVRSAVSCQDVVEGDSCTSEPCSPLRDVYTQDMPAHLEVLADLLSTVCVYTYRLHSLVFCHVNP